MRIPVSQIVIDSPMRADARVTNYAVARFLVLRGMVDDAEFRDRAADGVPRAWLAELEADGIEVEAIRTDLFQRVSKAIRHGATALRSDGLDFVIRDGALVTVRSVKSRGGMTRPVSRAQKVVAIREAIS